VFNQSQTSINFMNFADVAGNARNVTEAQSCRLQLDVFQPIGISTYNITPHRCGIF
jgi:hypothetical protein